MKSMILAAAVFSLSAVAAHAADTPPKGRILLVGSNANSITLKDGRPFPTGYFLNELAVPAQAFIAAGYDVVIATPDGNTPSVDALSLTPALFHGDEAAYNQAVKFALTYPGMQHPEKLSKVVQQGLGGFAAIYVPGGRAPMVDLMKDKSLGAALIYFHKTGKITAMLCHAPVAFTAALSDPVAFRKAVADGDISKAKSLAANWPYAGYKMTLLSTNEEKPKEDALGGKMPFYIEDAVRDAGAIVQVGAPGEPNLVVDREMITGQNPASDHLLADAVLKALAEKSAQ